MVNTRRELARYISSKWTDEELSQKLHGQHITPSKEQEWRKLKRSIKKELIARFNGNNHKFQSCKKDKKAKRKAKTKSLYPLSLLCEYNKNCEIRISVYNSLSVPRYTEDWVFKTRRELLYNTNIYELGVGNFLLRKGVKFVYQAPYIINNRIYFLDFYVPSKLIAIEIDGAYHTEDANRHERDILRDKDFESIGIITIRIPNKDTLHQDRLGERLSVIL